MTRVFALCSAADSTGSVKQFDLALPLLSERFEVVRYTLAAGGKGEWTARAALDAAGADVLHTLGAEAFRVAHGWATAALLPGRRKLPPWVAAGATAVEPPLGFAPGLTATISQSEYECDWAARLTPAPMQFSAPVAIEPPAAIASRGRREQCILVCGGFDAVANLRHIVWVFDTVRYANPTVRLVLIGDGPGRAEIERFALSDGLREPTLRFAGHQDDVDPLLAAACQVWSAHTRGGTKFLLEAMASGVPVIAVRTPDTERVIRDGANGRLVPVAQPVEMARVAHGLLASPDRARALVVAGEAEATRYPVADLADVVAGVYHTLTSSASPRPE